MLLSHGSAWNYKLILCFQTFQSHLEAGEKFVGRVSDDAMHVYELRQQLEEVWPEIIHNIVKSANQQMADRDKYMRQSLENLQ